MRGKYTTTGTLTTVQPRTAGLDVPLSPARVENGLTQFRKIEYNSCCDGWTRILPPYFVVHCKNTLTRQVLYDYLLPPRNVASRRGTVLVVILIFFVDFDLLCSTNTSIYLT